MRRNLSSICVAVALVALLASGCWMRGPARVHPPDFNPAAGQDAMEKYDANGDGEVTGEELDAAPALKAAIEQLDQDSSGGVSAKEVNARVDRWLEDKIGLTSFTCTIRMDGRPLDGATVTMVPEEFLGEKVKPATGVTDANGVAILSIADPPQGASGVAAGFYRVEISKKEGGQESIPAKYNTQTTLGQEVALDARGMEEGGVTFELSSR